MQDAIRFQVVHNPEEMWFKDKNGETHDVQIGGHDEEGFYFTIQRTYAEYVEPPLNKEIEFQFACLGCVTL